MSGEILLTRQTTPSPNAHKADERMRTYFVIDVEAGDVGAVALDDVNEVVLRCVVTQHHVSIVDPILTCNKR